jgi:hypothetical protein
MADTTSDRQPISDRMHQILGLVRNGLADVPRKVAADASRTSDHVCFWAAGEGKAYEVVVSDGDKRSGQATATDSDAACQVLDRLNDYLASMRGETVKDVARDGDVIAFADAEDGKRYTLVVVPEADDGVKGTPAQAPAQSPTPNPQPAPVQAEPPKASGVERGGPDETGNVS